EQQVAEVRTRGHAVVFEGDAVTGVLAPRRFDDGHRVITAPTCRRSPRADPPCPPTCGARPVGREDRLDLARARRTPRGWQRPARPGRRCRPLPLRGAVL